MTQTMTAWFAAPGSEGGVTLTLAPHERSTVVRTERGLLHLDRLSLTIGTRR